MKISRCKFRRSISIVVPIELVKMLDDKADDMNTDRDSLIFEAALKQIPEKYHNKMRSLQNGKQLVAS